MPCHLAMRPKLLAVIALAAGLAAVVGAAVLWLRSDAVVHAAWRDTILAAPAEALPALLREFDAQPDVAIPLLVELLSSERPEVVAAVGRALHETLEDWRLLPADEADRNIARLAVELASHVEELPPTGRQAAAELAKEMLLWPLDDKNIRTGDVLANCETILRSSKATGERAIGIEHAIADRPPIPADLKTPALAGGGLPETPAQLPPLPAVTPNATAQPPQSLLQPPGEFHAPLAIPLRLVEESPPPIERQSHNEVAGEVPSQTLADLSELQLARLLHASNPQVAAAAEQELRTRGLGDRELTLARALRHPDPREREAFARALPQIAGIDPQFWLNQLAGDEDPQVRRAAINIVASRDNEATTRWLLGRREQESNPQVARRIDELLKSRR